MKYMNLTAQYIINTLMQDTKRSSIIKLTVYITESVSIVYNFTMGFEHVLVFMYEVKYSKVLDFKDTKKFIIELLTGATKYSVSIDENHYDDIDINNI